MDFTKKICNRIFLLAVVCIGMFTLGYSRSMEPSQQSVLFQKIIEQFEKEMQNNYGLIPVGSGGRVHEKIAKFDIFFPLQKIFPFMKPEFWK